MLIGIAAGVKIVPGAFVLYYLARRQYAAAVRTTVASVSTVALSWLIAPQAAQTYWLGLVWDTSRSGGGGYPDNQSVVGVLARILQDDHPSAWLTLPIQVGVLVVTFVRAKQASDRDEHVVAFMCVAVGALLASPVSWSHHWVWCVPLVMILVDQRRWIAAATGFVVFSFSPLTLSPLGLLGGVPAVLWVTTTAMFPAFGLWWLIWGSHADVVGLKNRVT